MRKIGLLAILVLSIYLCGCNNAQENSLEEKAVIHARETIKKLSLSEKTAQMQAASFNVLKKTMDENGKLNRDSLVKYYPFGFGAINLNFRIDPKHYVQLVNDIQAYHQTLPNPIPVIFLGEGLHGLMSNGATVFPQANALGCTWDTLLCRRIYEATAIESHARGIRQLLSPVLDLAREPRFGRIEEMYSEDPYLVAQLGLAAVKGFQQLGDDGSIFVAATLKHYVGHGEPMGGRNVAPVTLSAYNLLNNHLYPFETCISETEVAAIMPAYNEVLGVPVHANKWLMQDVLRKQLGFKGLVTSDQNAVDELHRTHMIAPSFAHAAKMAVESGIDFDLIGNSGTFIHLDSLVANGHLDEKLIDNAVERVLVMKYKLGLYEHYEASFEHMSEVTNCDAHKQLALEAAHKSMVLLKNTNSTLPLNERMIKRIAVIGPNAADVHFGGYTAEPRQGISVLQGIQNFAEGKFDVKYAEGCKIAMEPGSFWDDNDHTPNTPEDDRRLISEAVKTAKECDVVLLVIGENESFAREAWGEGHRGDRESLELVGMQNELANQLFDTGKPVIVLIINGRPLDIESIAKRAEALIAGHYLGQEGGTAVADVIFGKVNPSGKLAVTMPKSAGELPSYYNHSPSKFRSYIHTDNAPIFPFGFGLSYTSFQYAAPIISSDVMNMNQTLKVTVNVKNTGARFGEEIVQLYIKDDYSEAARPVMELKRFAKIGLQAGESRDVVFDLDNKALSYYNHNLEKVSEPGSFTVFTGPNSVDLQSTKFNLIK